MIHENNGAPRVLRKKATYDCVDPYISDLLTFHDERFMAQQNAVDYELDCRSQIAAQTLLRTIAHHYCDRGMRYGPFYMQFTDLHPRNILVDEKWNITAIIDLEWICSRRAFMIDVPCWITGHAIDEIGEKFDYRRLSCQERGLYAHSRPRGTLQSQHSGQDYFLGPTMRLAWQTSALGTLWY